MAAIENELMRFIADNLREIDEVIAKEGWETSLYPTMEFVGKLRVRMESISIPGSDQQDEIVSTTVEEKQELDEPCQFESDRKKLENPIPESKDVSICNQKSLIEKKKVGRPSKRKYDKNLALEEKVRMFASSMSPQEMSEEFECSIDEIDEILKSSEIFTIVELSQPHASTLATFKFDTLFSKCKCKVNAGKSVWEIAREIYVHPDSIKLWVAQIRAESKKEKVTS